MQENVAPDASRGVIMGIRVRTITLVSLVVIALWAVLYVATGSEGQYVAEEIERQEVETTLQRASAAIEFQTDRLKSVVGDWAAWDDTYRFVRHVNQAYITSNLQDDALTTLGVDFMIYTDTAGRIVYSKALDPATHRPALVPKGLLRYLAGQPAFLHQSDPHGIVSGALALPEGPTLVAAEPIVTSDYRSPIAGTFVTGYLIQQPELASMARLTLAPVSLYEAKARDLRAGVSAARNQLLKGNKTVVSPVNDHSVAGYEFVTGIGGRPTLLLHVTQPRTALDLVQSSLAQSNVALYVFGVGLLAAIALTLDMTVLRRLARLRAQVDGIGRQGDPGARLVMKGTDEIARVAHDINGMLGTLEQSRRELAYLAAHDSLTRLHNRRYFEEELQRELAEQRRIGGSGAVLWLDLDYFKEINDSLGHAAGDELLVQLGNTLRGETREYSLIARLGGDEFGMLIPHTDEEEAVQTARRLLDMLASRTFDIGDHAIRVSASIGVVLYPAHGENIDDLLARADLAMYDAKESGRNRLSVYAQSDEWESMMAERIKWAERIVSALRDDRFLLYAQPTLNMRDGSHGPYELLLRMVGEDGEIVPPGQIIPTAEKLGLIRDIDRWVARQAIRLLAEEHRAGRDTSFSINLSGYAFSDPELLDLIREEFALSGAEPSKLVIEITETAAITDIERAREFIRVLKKVGCRFSLDDFGTGASSFYYLKHLPVDFLKIDGSLVKGLNGATADKHFVRAIVEMCNGLQISTVAEYIEDEALLDAIGDYGVDYVQGFQVGTPEPLDAYLKRPDQPVTSEPRLPRSQRSRTTEAPGPQALDGGKEKAGA